MLVCIANALCHVTTVHHHSIVCHTPTHPPFNGTNWPLLPIPRQVSIPQSISWIPTNEIGQSAYHLQYHSLQTIQLTYSKATSSSVILLRVNSIYMWFLYRNFIFYGQTRIRAWTKSTEPEPWCSGYGSRFSEPNLKIPIQVLARISWTWTRLDCGQSTTSSSESPMKHMVDIPHKWQKWRWSPSHTSLFSTPRSLQAPNTIPSYNVKP